MGQTYISPTLTQNTRVNNNPTAAGFSQRQNNPVQNSVATGIGSSQTQPTQNNAYIYTNPSTGQTIVPTPSPSTGQQNISPGSANQLRSQLADQGFYATMGANFGNPGKDLTFSYNIPVQQQQLPAPQPQKPSLDLTGFGRAVRIDPNALINSNPEKNINAVRDYTLQKVGAAGDYLVQQGQSLSNMASAGQKTSIPASLALSPIQAAGVGSQLLGGEMQRISANPRLEEEKILLSTGISAGIGVAAGGIGAGLESISPALGKASDILLTTAGIGFTAKEVIGKPVSDIPIGELLAGGYTGYKTFSATRPLYQDLQVNFDHPTIETTRTGNEGQGFIQVANKPGTLTGTRLGEDFSVPINQKTISVGVKIGEEFVFEGKGVTIADFNGKPIISQVTPFKGAVNFGTGEFGVVSPEGISTAKIFEPEVFARNLKLDRFLIEDQRVIGDEGTFTRIQDVINTRTLTTSRDVGSLNVFSRGNAQDFVSYRDITENVNAVRLKNTVRIQNDLIEVQNTIRSGAKNIVGTGRQTGINAYNEFDINSIKKGGLDILQRNDIIKLVPRKQKNSFDIGFNRNNILNDVRKGLFPKINLNRNNKAIIPSVLSKDSLPSVRDFSILRGRVGVGREIGMKNVQNGLESVQIPKKVTGLRSMDLTPELVLQPQKPSVIVPAFNIGKLQQSNRIGNILKPFQGTNVRTNSLQIPNSILVQNTNQESIAVPISQLKTFQQQDQALRNLTQKDLFTGSSFGTDIFNLTGSNALNYLFGGGGGSGSLKGYSTKKRKYRRTPTAGAAILGITRGRSKQNIFTGLEPFRGL